MHTDTWARFFDSFSPSRGAHLCVVDSLSQSNGVDADVNVTTLVHELEVGGALDPRGSARERQVKLQVDSLRVSCDGRRR